MLGPSMSLAVAVLFIALGIFVIYLLKRRRRADASAAAETSPALEAWVCDALEDALAAHVLQTLGSVAEERKRLQRTLRGEPDIEMVAKIEDKVQRVSVEYVRYAHEKDVEVTLRVAYESGDTDTAQKRLPLSDVPQAVRDDFEQKGSTRVFRPWDFPWARPR
jgi:hypothetical protein